MYRDISKMRKTYKQQYPQKYAAMDSRNLHLSQAWGLCALVFAIFLASLGLLCSCVGFCKLNAASSSANTIEYSSARLASGYGFALSVLILLVRVALLVHFFKF